MLQIYEVAMDQRISSYTCTACEQVYMAMQIMPDKLYYFSPYFFYFVSLAL